MTHQALPKPQTPARWRAASGHWYPIAALTRPETRVCLSGPGYVCEGWRGAGRFAAFFAAKGPGAPGAAKGVRIASERSPHLFQPLGAWPDLLPEPVISSAEVVFKPSIGIPIETPAVPQPDEFHALSSPGSISIAEAEIRITRALRTCRTYREIDFDLAADHILWPAVLREWSDFTGHVDDAGKFIARDQSAGGTRIDEPPPRVRFAPTPRDHSDCLVAMAWFAALAPVIGRYRHKSWSLSGDQLLMLRRALDPPWSWRQIGEEAGRSHEWARQRYDAVMDRIWGIANA